MFPNVVLTEEADPAEASKHSSDEEEAPAIAKKTKSEYFIKYEIMFLFQVNLTFIFGRRGKKPIMQYLSYLLYRLE